MASGQDLGAPDDIMPVASASVDDDGAAGHTMNPNENEVATEMAANEPQQAQAEEKEEDDDELPPPTLSDSALRKKSVREYQEKRLRVVVEDLWSATSDAASKQSTSSLTKKSGGGGDRLKAGQHESSVIDHRFTSILIDEVNDETQQFETTTVSLPKSPICALLLMESIGIFQDLDRVNQLSIIASIIVTIVAQMSAGATIFTKQLWSRVETDYDISSGFLNLVVISFIVIYLSQDCAQIYKMVVLLRWMRSAGKLKRHSAVLIALYLVTNLLLYLFLLYYSIVELLINDDIGEKLEAAVAVYFILELDDWLYNVTIEPLKILEDEIFQLDIRGIPGSRSKRMRRVTYCFWGIFVSILAVQLVLFITKAQDSITLNDDTGN